MAKNEEEDGAKPIKKKIRLSNSSKRSSKDITSIEKENPKNSEESREKRVHSEDIILNGICTNTFIPETSRNS